MPKDTKPTSAPPSSPITQPGSQGDQHVQLRRILALFRPYRGRLALVGALVAAASLVSVATPFLLREILDVAIPEQRSSASSRLA